MSALYGRMQGERAEITRTAHYTITSKLETWHGRVQTELDRDGTFRVYIGEKYGARTLVMTGNVNDGERGVSGVYMDGKLRDGFISEVA